MFCRYCGAQILEDSLFCAKCGKRLGNRKANPRVEEIVARYRLNTPYPYFGLLLFLCAIWVATTHKPAFDYSQTKWSIEMDRKMDTPAENMFRESLSIVVENTGSKPLNGIPIELHAVIEPQKMAEVVAVFPSDRETLIEAGKSRPVAIVLSDAIAAGAKRRYVMDEIIQTQAPFKVTLQVVQDNAKVVLADHIFER